MSDHPLYDDDQGPVFQAAPAVRQAVPALVSLWGYSSSGKTFSALALARGLVGPAGQFALIDTENKRALQYADEFHGTQGPWLHFDMQPPFTPDRYTAAHRCAIAAGAGAIIIDSASHVWAGEGGVIEQADRVTTHGLNKWRAPKLAYTRMSNAMFRSPVHTIFCLRAKSKNVQLGKGKDAEIINVGDVPICDPAMALVYESTIVCHMQSGIIGQAVGDTPQYTPLDPIKAPRALAGVIRPGEFITVDMGARIAAWLAGGAYVDPEQGRWRTLARERATGGSTALRDWWAGNVTKDARLHLQPILAELKQIAGEADDEMARTEGEIVAANAGDALDDPFTPSAARAPSEADAIGRLHEQARERATGGTDAFTDWFNAIPAAEREALYAIMDELERVASHADRATGGKKNPFARNDEAAA